MTMTSRIALPVAALLGLGVVAGAAEDPLPGTLRGVVAEQVRAYDAEDTDAVLRTIHSRSPDYDTMKAALPKQFAAEDLSVQLVDFRYMGHDDEFAIARVKTRVTGPPGSGFQDNLIDSVMLFHREGALWKLWSDDVLGVDFEQKVGSVAPNYPTPR